MLEVENTVSTQRIYEGRVINLRVDTLLTPEGRETKREIVEHRGAVAVVAIDDKKNIILVRQFRKAADKVLLEIPAGTLEKGEAPEVTVLREMQEETGYLPGKIVRLGGFYSAPGFCTEFIYLYLATDLKSSRLEADADEQIELERMPVVEAKKLVDSGAICDAKSIIGILTYLDYMGKKS